MDPISTELLAALAGGAGGEVAKQAWAGLRTLVRRPFGRGQAASDVPAISSGEAEMTALEQAPEDPSCAQALSQALSARSALDLDFGTELERWRQQVQLTSTGSGDVHNEISGSPTFHGPVTLSRDVFGASMPNSPASPPPPPQESR